MGMSNRNHLAAADCLLMYRNTTTFFTYTEYESFRGDFIGIHSYDIPCSCAETYKLREGKRMTVDSSIPQPRLTSLPPTNQQDLWVGNYIEKTAEEKQWDLLSEEERLAEANRILSLPQKSYHSNYIWGQLVYWFNQTSNDPCLRY